MFFLTKSHDHIQDSELIIWIISFDTINKYIFITTFPIKLWSFVDPYNQKVYY